ncbi:MAG: GNAT family N-acetyltransferase [Planctomycetota bacterium]
MTLHTAERIQRAQELIHTVFGDKRNLAGEYPLVFDPSFSGSLVGLEVEEDVVSACAVLPRDLVLNGWLLRVGLIGSVCTAEDQRGKGYATQMLRRAEDQLFCEGAVVSMLWADEAEFYERMGYVPVGSEVDYHLPLELAEKLPDPEGVRWMRASDHAAVHALYVRHSHRIDRNLAETSALLFGPDIQALVLEREGEVQGYVLLGRGNDLQGVVHEWGGSTEAVLTCLSALLRNLPAECPGVYLMCPATAVDMRRSLLEMNVLAIEGVLGMAKVLDMAAVAKVFTRFGDRRLKVSVGKDVIYLSGPRGTAALDAKKTMLAIMPPQGNRGVVDAIEEEIGLSFDALPLYPFAWGLDSI